MTEMQLKRSVRKKVEKVLYPMSVGRSGTWMDEIKSDHAFDYAYSWHYMTSVNGEYDESIQEKGGNVYAEINRIKNELKAGNLDSVWDSGILDGKAMSYTEIGDELSRRVKKDLIKKYRAGTMQDWLAEAVAARSSVYDLPESMKISYAYGYEYTPLLEERLIAASVRLAQILEEIYG